MLRINRRKGSPYYQITGTHRGVRVRESAGTADKKTAEQIARERERQLDQGFSGKKTLADAIEAYLLGGGEDRFLGRINEGLGRMPIEAITQDVIDRKCVELYGGYRRTPNGKIHRHAASTIHRQFYSPLIAVLNKAAELGWAPYKKIKKPRVTLPAPEWAEADWFERLWTVCEPGIKALTLFLMTTGCRIGEALALEWRDVDRAQGLAFIRVTKTRTFRTVRLTPMCLDAIAAMTAMADPEEKRDPGGKVFPYKKHNVRWRVEKGCREAGIPYLSSHKFGSHTFATMLRRTAGADARTLRDTGRWKSIQMAERYTHTDVSEAADLAVKLDDLFKPK